MQLDPQHQARRFETEFGSAKVAGSQGIGGAAGHESVGIVQTVQVVRREVAPGVFSITPAVPLQLGEYALHLESPLAPAFAIFDFSVAAQPLLSATTVFIQNESEDGGAADALAAAVRSWGRYEAVPSRRGAGLVFLLTGKSGGHLQLAITPAGSNSVLWSATDQYRNTTGKSLQGGADPGKLVSILRNSLKAWTGSSQ